MRTLQFIGRLLHLPCGFLHIGTVLLAALAVDVEAQRTLSWDELAVAYIELVPEADDRMSRVLVAGEDVTEKLASPRVDRRVSEVSAQPAVRAALLPRQRHLAKGGGIRVGIGDNPAAYPDMTNAELVERAVGWCRDAGRAPASADDVRSRFAATTSPA